MFEVENFILFFKKVNLNWLFFFIQDFDQLEVIGTANPVNRERVQSNLGMLEEEERFTEGGMDQDYL